MNIMSAMNVPTQEELSKGHGRITFEEYIKRKYPDFYQFLVGKYLFTGSYKEKVYCYNHNIVEQPLCPACGAPVKFHGFVYGYAKFCGSSCAGRDPKVREKLVNTCTDKYGDDYISKFHDWAVETTLERYGVDNVMKSDAIKEKFVNTCREKYGVDNPMKINECKEKSKQTCLEKYNHETYFGSERHLSRINKDKEKIKSTCLNKYGEIRATKNEEVKQKISDTVHEKYGVKWSCMREEAHHSHNKDSKPNINFAKILDDNNIIYDREFPIDKYLYDFRINDVLIEINPSVTHNINWSPYTNKEVNKNYHQQKTKIANQNGYRCIHVWDWDDVDKIISIVNSKQSIYARKCEVREVPVKEAKCFINKYHLQNWCRGNTIRYGLYHNNELVQIMTFGKPRYNKKYQWELLRLCTKAEFMVVGGAEKIFNFFISKYHPDSIISYCDLSKFSGAVYDKLGFIKTNNPQPSCHWWNVKQNVHVTNSLLLKNGFDRLFGTDYGKNTSNEQLMLQHGFVSVFDCGQATYSWKKQDII